MKNNRGATPVDIVLWLVILALAAANVALLDDVYGAYYRKSCYVNQAALDKALWDANYQREREIWDVQAAYAIQYPDARPPVLVILYNPRFDQGETARTTAVVDLTQQGYSAKLTCPLHRDKPSGPVIDYWFAFGRWHCLYNRYHSE
jgi:hypothetical protein